MEYISDKDRNIVTDKDLGYDDDDEIIEEGFEPDPYQEQLDNMLTEE